MIGHNHRSPLVPTGRLLSLGLAAVLASVFAFASTASAQDKFEEARKVRRSANASGAEAQKSIDSLSDQTDTLFAKYSNALKQIDSIRVYNDQMRGLITYQEGELESLASQLDRVEVVGRSVSPLMLRMIEALDALTNVDIPFLIEERKGRVAELRELMGRADVNNAEKFRRIMEAYQIENEFGRTIEAYRSSLKRDGKEIKVDLLRFGRISLVYQTLDGGESGLWNQQTRQWEVLDGSYTTAIREGLRIARKQAAPDLIRLPLPAAQEVES